MDFDEFLCYYKVSVITCQAKQLCEVLSLTFSRKIQHFFRKKTHFFSNYKNSCSSFLCIGSFLMASIILLKIGRFPLGLKNLFKSYFNLLL